MALYDKMGFPNVDPNGRVNEASVRDVLDFFVGRGLVMAPVDLRQVVDRRFAEAAVRAPGPYSA